MSFENETLLRQYFLGTLSQEETDRIEEEFFRDDQVFAELQTVETELIDSYVAGELSESEQKQFETSYLGSADRKEKVKNAESLIAALAEISAGTPVAAPMHVPMRQGILAIFRSVSLPLRIGFATAAIAILVFGLITLAQNRSLRTELRRLRAHEAELHQRNQELERQVIGQSGLGQQGPSGSREEIGGLQFPASLVASISLKPGLSRSVKDGAHDELVIPRTARFVLLILSLESDEYPSGYSATIETVNRDEVERLHRLKSRSGAGGVRVVEVPISAESLISDAYVVKLLGITKEGGEEAFEDYSFQVVRR